MKTPLIVRLLDLFSVLFKHSGIDYDQLRILLIMKFNLDKRKATVLFRNARFANKKNNMLLVSLIFYGVIGLLFGSYIMIAENQYTFAVYSMFFFMFSIILSSVILMEFSSDIFDMKDQKLLMPKPLTKQMINLAKNLHVFLYLLQIMLAFSLPGIVLTSIRFNVLSGLIMLIMSVLLLSFLFFVSSIIYGMILKRFSGERLKDAINVFQIAATVVTFVGYQGVIQTSHLWLDKIDSENLGLIKFLFIPSWFASPIYMISQKIFSIDLFILPLIGIFFSIFGLLYYFKIVSPRFEKDLMKLNENKLNESLKSRKSILNIFFDNIDSAFYHFSMISFSRERKLKRVIYPNLILGIVFPFLILYTSTKSLDVPIYESKYFLVIYYVNLMCVQLSVYYMYSEYNNASWIYKYFPIKKPGKIVKAAQLAFLMKYQIPMMLFISVVFLIIWRFEIIMDVIIVFLNLILIQYINFSMSKRHLPFSIELRAGQLSNHRTSSYLISFFVFIPISILIHYLISDLNLYKIPFVLLQIISIYLISKRYYSMKWSDLE